MPLPIGHTAIGLAAHSLVSKNHSNRNWWKVLMGVILLSNLPDVDVAIGLFLQGNGSAFHRGPTHGLLFAVAAGLLASNGWRLGSQIPRFSFTCCFLLILSHVLADGFFTQLGISFFWPLTANWSGGYMGWKDVVDSVLFGNFQNAEIIIGCGLFILLYRTSKRLRPRQEGESKRGFVLQLPKGIVSYSRTFLERHSSRGSSARR